MYIYIILILQILKIKIRKTEDYVLLQYNIYY